jgi:hypothetical protein
VVPIVNQLLAPAPPPMIAPPAAHPTRAVEAPRVAAPAPERRRAVTVERPRGVAAAGPPLDSPAIMQGVRPQIPAIRACLAGARVNVSFSLDIDGRGRVRAVNLMSPPPSTTPGRCVARALSHLSYPPGHPTANARMFLTP